MCDRRPGEFGFVILGDDAQGEEIHQVGDAAGSCTSGVIRREPGNAWGHTHPRMTDQSEQSYLQCFDLSQPKADDRAFVESNQPTDHRDVARTVKGSKKVGGSKECTEIQASKGL